MTLAAVTQRTDRVMIGTGVTCPTFRYRPAVVAQAWATLDQLAPGRTFLGLGAGENLNEGAAGGGWGTYNERAERLVESVEIIRKLWTGDEVRMKGRYWDVAGKLYDTPKTGIPIYIAAGGPKSANLAGTHGDGLVTGARTLRNNAEVLASWKEGVRASGRDPADLPKVVEHWAVVGDESMAKEAAEKWRFAPKAWNAGFFDNMSPADIEERANNDVPLASVYKDWVVSEDPEEHIRAIRFLAQREATHIVVHIPMTDQSRVIDFYGKNVIPAFRQA
jgi:F420-dependent hydroxymycolic acid dehydrogenase